VLFPERGVGVQSQLACAFRRAVGRYERACDVVNQDLVLDLGLVELEECVLCLAVYQLPRARQRGIGEDPGILDFVAEPMTCSGAMPG